MNPTDFKSINLFVGVNGAGKSKLLLELAGNYLDGNATVLAVDNSGFGKLNSIKNKKYKCCGAYHGVYGVYKTFKKILLDIEKENSGFFRVWTTLEYVGYDPRVGVRVLDLDMERMEDDADYFQDFPGELLAAIRYFEKNLNGSGNAVWFDATVDRVFNVINSSVFLLLKHETFLRKRGLISGFDIFLSKGGAEIALPDASSGELSIIATLLFLYVNSVAREIVLIDEPENSLHPQWQKDYLSMVYDVLYLFEPTMFVATHSPIILSGVDGMRAECSAYLVEVGGIEKIQEESDGVEGVLWRYFGVVTPRNHYLSERVLECMSFLERGMIDYDEFLNRIDLFEKGSYSRKQKLFLESIKDLAKKVVR